MGFFSKAKDQKPENVFKRRLESNHPDFKIGKEFQSYDHSSGLVVDESNTKIAIWTKLSIHELAEIVNKAPKGSKPLLDDIKIFTQVYDYKDIISSEIVEDGSSITKTSRTSQLASAAIGGALLGGVGAVVGGLTAKQKNINTVSKIEVNILFNSTDRPRFKLLLLKLVSPVKRDSILYKGPIDKANEVNALMRVLIKRADEEAAPTSTNEPQQTLDIPGQIRKLAELQKDGILSETEFEAKKAELLAKM